MTGFASRAYQIRLLEEVVTENERTLLVPYVLERHDYVPVYPTVDYFDPTLSVPVGYREALDISATDGHLCVTHIRWDATGGVSYDKELLYDACPRQVVQFLKVWQLEHMPCAFTSSPHHSDDLVQVHCGRPRPIPLCGYHASEAWLSNAIAYVTREATCATP